MYVILREFVHAIIKRGYGHVISYFIEGVVVRSLKSFSSLIIFAATEQRLFTVTNC